MSLSPFPLRQTKTACFPAKAGTQTGLPPSRENKEGKATSRLKRPHPGGGRGPVGKVAVTTDRTQLATFPNWAPAFAGVVRWTVSLLTRRHLPLAGEDQQPPR